MAEAKQILSLSPVFFNPNDRKAQIPTNPIPQNVLKFNLKHIFAWIQRQSSTSYRISIRLIRTHSTYTPILVARITLILKYREDVKERERKKRTWWMEIGDMGWTMNPVFSATSVNTNSFGGFTVHPLAFLSSIFRNGEWGLGLARFMAHGYQPGVFVFFYLFIHFLSEIFFWESTFYHDLLGAFCTEYLYYTCI